MNGQHQNPTDSAARAAVGAVRGVSLLLGSRGARDMASPGPNHTMKTYRVYDGTAGIVLQDDDHPVNDAAGDFVGRVTADDWSAAMDAARDLVYAANDAAGRDDDRAFPRSRPF